MIEAATEEGSPPEEKFEERRGKPKRVDQHGVRRKKGGVVE